MSYLNVDLNYFNHPKTVRLIGLLGKDSAVLPIRLWCYCGKYHCEDGNLNGYSDVEIESIVGWIGARSEMVAAMIKVGFIFKTDDGYAVNDWLDHQGHLAMFKRRAKENAQKRWGVKNATSNANGNEEKASPLPKSKTEPKSKAFIPPTLDQVKEYCKERNNAVDFNKFHAFYEANGWAQGRGKKIKDWKAAVRTWEKPRADFEPPKKRPAFIIAMEYRALKWDDKRIKDHLLDEKYSEYEIDEALGKKF